MTAARSLLALAAAGLLAVAGAGARAADAPSTADDRAIGSPKAPVTVIEYASPTCPHCAHFRADVFPAFKKKYIDTGKVRLILRETPIHPEFDGAVFLLARCAPKDKYFSVLDAFMEGQKEYFAPELTQRADAETAVVDAFRTVLRRTAQQVGLSDQQAESCLADEKQVAALNDRAERETKEFEVHSTPTFVVDGVKLDPQVETDLARLDAAIQPELAKHKPHTKRR